MQMKKITPAVVAAVSAVALSGCTNIAQEVQASGSSNPHSKSDSSRPGWHRSYAAITNGGSLRTLRLAGGSGDTGTVTGHDQGCAGRRGPEMLGVTHRAHEITWVSGGLSKSRLTGHLRGARIRVDGVPYVAEDTPAGKALVRRWTSTCGGGG